MMFFNWRRNLSEFKFTYLSTLICCTLVIKTLILDNSNYFRTYKCKHICLFTYNCPKKGKNSKRKRGNKKKEKKMPNNKIFYCYIHLKTYQTLRKGTTQNVVMSWFAYHALCNNWVLIWWPAGTFDFKYKSKLHEYTQLALFKVVKLEFNLGLSILFFQ